MPDTRFLWPVHSRLRTESTIPHFVKRVYIFGVFLVLIFLHSDWIRRDRISPSSVRMKENMDQHNSKYGHISFSAVFIPEYAVKENRCYGIFYAVNDFSLREWSFTSNHAMIPPKMSIKVLQWRVWHDDKDLDAKYFPLLSIVYFRL